MNDEETRTAPANERLHDIDTIARRLNVSTRMVRRLISRHELGFHRVGRLMRISEGQYQEYLARVRWGRGL
jgi:excisionase family DNA binding protein